MVNRRAGHRRHSSTIDPLILLDFEETSAIEKWSDGRATLGGRRPPPRLFLHTLGDSAT
jgi:hypothetical protein